MISGISSALALAPAPAGPPANGVHVVAASAGFASYLLVWAAVMWGMFLRNGWASTRVRHSTLYSTHMGLGLLGLCLGLVHGLAQTVAPVTATRLVDVVVPFLNLDDPTWGDLPRTARLGQGAGVLALELMVAATLALAVRNRLGQNRWRAVHLANYVGYLLMVVHVLVSGSDAGRTWAWATVLGTTAVTGLTWMATTRWAVAARRRSERTLNISRPGGRLSVEVDPRLCTRFGFCEHEAPGVFQLSGDGRLTYDASVPVELADGVVRAARVCPARAIRLGQEATQVVMPSVPVPDDTGPQPTLIPFDRASRRVPQ
ncbi:MAG: ferredoxin [Kineosporiaceae bacterium]|jgi:ferredoxin/DMSO/TMAO reductase YedYZ heme-binding membrane subunit